jgi:hypothetical protein
MTRKILIIILIILINIKLYCNDNKKLKALDFSIGGGLENSLNFKYQNQSVNTFSGQETYEEENYLISFGTHLFIPFSLVFYIKDNFGIGFKVQNGILLLSPNYRNSNIDFLDNNIFRFSGGLINELMFVNKIGNYFDDNLLIEYGLSTLASIYSSKGIIELLIGPKTMIGFEKKFKNKLAIVVGGNMASYFKIYPSSITFNRSILDVMQNRYPNYNTTFINNFSVHLLIGAEIRLKFSLIKEFN